MLVRTRIAPSPTGFPHIGTIYQVLFDFAYAHKYNGKFILRIEDTDRARFVEGAEEIIFRSLDWFGLTPDEGPVQGGISGRIVSLNGLTYTRNMHISYSIKDMRIIVFVVVKDLRKCVKNRSAKSSRLCMTGPVVLSRRGR